MFRPQGLNGTENNYIFADQVTVDLDSGASSHPGVNADTGLCEKRRGDGEGASLARQYE